MKIEDDETKSKFHFNPMPFGGIGKDEFEFHNNPLENAEVKVSVTEKHDIKFQSNNYGSESKFHHQQKPDIFIKNIHPEQNARSPETLTSGQNLKIHPHINHQS